MVTSTRAPFARHRGQTSVFIPTAHSSFSQQLDIVRLVLILESEVDSRVKCDGNVLLSHRQNCEVAHSDARQTLLIDAQGGIIRLSEQRNP